MKLIKGERISLCGKCQICLVITDPSNAGSWCNHFSNAGTEVSVGEISLTCTLPDYTGQVLTDDEILNLPDPSNNFHYGFKYGDAQYDVLKAFARAIEAATLKKVLED